MACASLASWPGRCLRRTSSTVSMLDFLMEPATIAQRRATSHGLQPTAGARLTAFAAVEARGALPEERELRRLPAGPRQRRTGLAGRRVEREAPLLRRREEPHPAPREGVARGV